MATIHFIKHLFNKLYFYINFRAEEQRKHLEIQVMVKI